MPKHIVAAATEIPPGGRKLVEVEGREIGIFNVGGDYYALLNRCPHEGASLCKGTLIGLMSAEGPGRYTYSRQGEILRCPWHGWEFDVRTGKSCAEPERLKLRRYEVEVQTGEKLATELQAETFPVMVEDSYVVVEV